MFGFRAKVVDDSDPSEYAFNCKYVMCFVVVIAVVIVVVDVAAGGGNGDGGGGGDNGVLLLSLFDFCAMVLLAVTDEGPFEHALSCERIT